MECKKILELALTIFVVILVSDSMVNSSVRRLRTHHKDDSRFRPYLHGFRKGHHGLTQEILSGRMADGDSSEDWADAKDTSEETNEEDSFKPTWKNCQKRCCHPKCLNSDARCSRKKDICSKVEFLFGR